jgi:uncharacterized integral membrane protein
MRWFHLTVIVLFVAATVVVAVQNFQSVTASFLGMSVRIPLALLIAVIYLLGAATGGSLLALLRRSVAGARRDTAACGLLAALLAFSASDARADESGVSFWLPGQYGSFAATSVPPGWSFETTFYHATAKAGAERSFARGGGIQVGVSSPSDYLMFTPTYVFATPVLGGQAAVGMTALLGRNSTTVSATLTGPGGATLSGSRSDAVTGFGDLNPTASLKWNRDAHNVMLYATAGIPVGVYDPARLASLGLGHWAVDAGAGYTYLDEQAGFEWSAVLGLTRNFINPYTQYRSGTDAHLDWAISPYLSDTMHIGAVGYFYRQLSGDSGPGATLGEFKSRVAGVGPQIGWFFPVADRQGYLNIRGYYEFDASHRLSGWNAYVTFAVEPSEGAPAPRAVRGP